MDRKILRILQEEPDIAVTALAHRVGLSHTPCWRRVKQLKANGTIKARAVILDPRAVGVDICVLANIRLKAHDEATLDGLENAVRGYPEIVDCFATTGDSDYLCRIVAPDIGAYESFLKKVLLHLPGVASVNSCVALKCIKNTTKLPI